MHRPLHRNIRGNFPILNAINNCNPTCTTCRIYFQVSRSEMASGMKMFEDVRPWLQVCCESDDLLAIGRIPYSITEIGFCLGLDYRDIYGIDHNYRQHYEKTLQLLTLWKNKNGSNATLWNLIVCLQKLGDGQLLEEFQTAIQKRYADSLCPSSG